MVGSTMHVIGLFILAPSIILMMNGGTVIFTALFSILALERKLDLHHYIGIILAVFGVFLVGLSAY